MQTIKFNKLNLKPLDTVLDIGCGEGRHAIALFVNNYVHAVGFDLSLKDLKIAKERLKDFEIPKDNKANCYFGVGDICYLPFGDNSYSSVVCSEVLEHLDKPNRGLEELIRVLKPEGILAVSVPRFFPEWICWKLSEGYQKTPGGHVRIFRHNELKRIFLEKGLIYEDFHWAHALHSPYWWLKCLFWENKKEPWVLKMYHKFLIWDLMKKPILTKVLEFLLQPLIGKSLVMYFRKPK